jgi:hypothetical protein
MTPEQKAAFIMAQAAAANAAVAGMQAENAHRVACGMSIAYGEEAFQKVGEDYIIHHNDVITFFQRMS